MIGDYIGGPIVGVAGKKLGSIAADEIGKATGYGLKTQIHKPYSQIISRSAGK